VDFDITSLRDNQAKAMCLFTSLNNRIKLLSQKLLYNQVNLHLDQAERLLEMVFGGEYQHTIQFMKLNFLRKEALCKRMSRNKAKWLVQTQALVKNSLQIADAIFPNSYYKARALVHRGDIELEEKEGDKAAQTYLDAQIMITALYGSDHPMIIYFNAAIIDAK